MSLPLLLSFFATIFFAITAIIFGIREEKLKREITISDEVKKRRMYELSMLRAIQDRIGYSLDVEQVIDTISSSLKNLFPYSTASSLIIDKNKVIFKTYIEERVSTKFIQQVKQSMTASLGTIIGSPLPEATEETRRGLAADEINMQLVSSFFHIPLVVSGTVVGLINVSSTTPGLYKEADMTILYQIVAQASNALSRLQEVIRTEEGKLLGMIRSLADGVFMIDKDNQLTLINERATTFLGLLNTNTPSIFDVLGKLSVRYDFSKKIAEAITQNKTIEESELVIENRTLQIIITPVIDHSEQSEAVMGVSVLMHDISLEKQVANLKEDFTNAVVHELRSPLTAIKSASLLMLTENEKLAETQKEKLLDIISKQTERMLNDIASLLDAAKLDSGRFTLYKKPTDVASLLEDAVALYSAQAKDKKIGIELDVEKNIPKGYFDPARIEQVLNNLISNSLKFTQSGGIITIHARTYMNDYLPKTVTNPGILISVSDTGIGIPKEKQAVLFSKFSQLDNVVHVHGQEGTGLGLYIAKGIIEAHQGNIFLQSVPNQGTSVSFTLRIAQDIPLDINKNTTLVKDIIVMK